MVGTDNGAAFADRGIGVAEPAFRTLVDLRELQRAHGGDVFAWAGETGIDPREIVDLSASINPLGPPASARKAFVASLEAVSRYPDGDGRELSAALARRHGVKPAEVLLGNGSTQLIYLLCRALKPRRALVVRPAFSEYANALLLGGAEVRSYFLPPLHDFELPLRDLAGHFSRGLDMIFLSNPNSATGRLVSRIEAERLVRLCSEKKIFLVVDEAFMDFLEGESVDNLIGEHPYLVVLRSLTKYYSLAGLRIGYLLAQSRIVDRLGLHQEPWSVNGPVQKVALACLADARFGLKTSRWLERERSFLLGGLAGMKGLRPYPSRTNFVLARLERAPGDAVELRRFLLRRGILIRCCDTFPGLGKDYFRAAVHLRKNNERLLKGLKAFLRSARRPGGCDGGR